MSELAIFGGSPVRTRPFPAYRTIGEEEREAAVRVVSRGVLSDYLGRSGPKFRGGEEVQALEAEWCTRFGVKHAVSVNSATSGLYAALAAAGVGPGDEVVVTPYSMSASAVGPFVYGAKPVFADIEPETFCISRATIERVITEKTKAIVVVDLFGHPADFDPIMELARSRGIVVIEDAAQASGATYHGRAAGTLADIGVFSLNVHKVIQTGEGGVAVTNDDRLAERLRLVRNHAEAVIRDRGTDENADLVGFNYRMTELEAAIAREQLKKLDGLVEGRQQASNYLRERIASIPGLRPPVVREGCTSVFYQLPIVVDVERLGVSRDRFVEAVRAEGVPVAPGYVEPLYLQPIFRSRHPGDPAYARGVCPVVESMHFERLFATAQNHPSLSRADLDDVANAMAKVAAHAQELRTRENG